MSQDDRSRAPESRPTPPASALLFFALVLGSSVLLSSCTYRWVERPSIRLGNEVYDSLDSEPGSRP